MSKLEKYLQKALARSPKATQSFLLKMPSSYWEKTVKNKALAAYKKASEEVSAYKEVLKINNINAKKIKKIKDFYDLPITNKKNYLKSFSINELVSGKAEDLMTMTVSSGSSGQPIYYPTSRNDMIAFPNGMITFFDYFWDIASKKKKTLFINAMAAGMWMGSVFGSYVFARLAQKHKNFSFINTGAEVDRVLDVLKMLSEKYDLVLLTTYPSLIITIIYVAKQRGLKLNKINLKYISGGELLDDATEEIFFKTFKVSSKSDNLSAIFDAYGGTEIGNPGLATPLAIMIKRICRRNKRISREIFANDGAVGTFFQQTPSSYIEEKDGSLLVTKDGMMPVIRYDCGDCGKVISYEKVMGILKAHNIDVFSEMRKAGWHKQSFKWPFLLMTRRSDWSVSFYGALVSPESIMDVILCHNEIRSFKLFDKSSRSRKVEFRIVAELNPGTKMSKKSKEKLGKIISSQVLNHLLRCNFDFKDAYSIYMKFLLPRIEFVDFNNNIFKGEYQRKPKLINT